MLPHVELSTQGMAGGGWDVVSGAQLGTAQLGSVPLEPAHCEAEAAAHCPGPSFTKSPDRTMVNFPELQGMSSHTDPEPDLPWESLGLPPSD